MQQKSKKTSSFAKSEAMIFLNLKQWCYCLKTGKLPQKYKPHKLTGNYKGRMECHIKPDWLLVWKQDEQNKEIYLERTGTHADLF